MVDAPVGDDVMNLENIWADGFWAGVPRDKFTDFWKSMPVDEFKTLRRDAGGVLNAEQCVRLWQHLGAQGQPPARLRAFY